MNGPIQQNAPNLLKKIKSTYILGIVIKNTFAKVKLSLLKYNKSLRKTLNLDIKEYQKFRFYYSPVEIELNPRFNINGRFIDMRGRSDYFVVYINDRKLTVPREFIKKSEKGKKIKIIVSPLCNFFPSFRDSEIYAIKFTRIQRINFTDLSFIFSGCSRLKKIDLGNINTIKINNMSCMFENCSSLRELDLDSLNTSNVTDMSGMFQNCSSLTDLSINKFNTSNVTNMSYMFSNCKSLKRLYLSNFNTSNVRDMSYMFSGCEKLSSIHIENFNFDNVKDFKGMFEFGCPNRIIFYKKQWFVCSLDIEKLKDSSN